MSFNTVQNLGLCCPSGDSLLLKCGRSCDEYPDWWLHLGSDNTQNNNSCCDYRNILFESYHGWKKYWLGLTFHAISASYFLFVRACVRAYIPVSVLCVSARACVCFSVLCFVSSPFPPPPIPFRVNNIIYVGWLSLELNPCCPSGESFITRSPVCFWYCDIS